jgi:hypothetical protein
MMKKQPTARELILKLLEEKSTLKQDVYQNMLARFAEFKQVIRQTALELSEHMQKVDKRVTVAYKDRGEFESELQVAGDVLIFHMHTNVFEFDKTHPLWKTSYVKNTPEHSYCGMIVVYNFLADSFRFNRVNDVGYMVARIFINRENHYFVEGKRQMGFLYNDLSNGVMDMPAISSVVESIILYSLDFDLLTPPFDSVKEVSVSEIQEAANAMQLKTGKRLGFRFQADTDQIE